MFYIEKWAKEEINTILSDLKNVGEATKIYYPYKPMVIDAV